MQLIREAVFGYSIYKYIEDIKPLSTVLLQKLKKNNTNLIFQNSCRRNKKPMREIAKSGI